MERLAQLQPPAAAAVGDCFAICAALVQGGAPGRVLAELLAVFGGAGGAPGSGDVPLLGRLIAAESAAGAYPATQALLRLVLSLVTSAAPPAALCPLVSFVMHRVLAEHHHWRYARRTERWRLAATALRVVRNALLAAPSPAHDGGLDGRDGSGGGGAIAAAAAAVLRLDVGMSACLFTALPPHASVLEVRQDCWAASLRHVCRHAKQEHKICSFVTAHDPPCPRPCSHPCLHQRMGLSSQLRSDDELAAIEECCVEWHRLLPVLLPPGAPQAMLAPAAFFRDGASPVPVLEAEAVARAPPLPGAGALLALPAPTDAGAAALGGQGGPPPAAVLLSYLTYQLFDSSQLGLVVRSAACLAAAAAVAVPLLPFAAMLPHAPQPEADARGGARGGVHPAARRALAAALSPASAAATPALFAAAADVVAQAVRGHPSLADALLFPCSLEQAVAEKENTDGNAAAGKAGGAEAAGAGGNGKAAAPAAAPVAGPVRKSSKAAPPLHSCLDALWELLQHWRTLREEAPAALAKLMQVLAALWHAGDAAYRALSLLQQQAGLWPCLIGLLAAAEEEGALQPLPAAGPEEEGGEGKALSWAAHSVAAAQLEAEGYALQIVAAECYSWGAAAAAAGTSAGAGLPTGLPPDLASFAKQAAGGGPGAAALLRRYCSPQLSSQVVGSLQCAAAAAGLQLLGAALGDEALWYSLGVGEGLLPLLAAAAAPLRRQFGADAEAARALEQHAEAVAARDLAVAAAAGGEGGGSAAAVAAALLRQAEVPERLAADREFGPAFIYDAALFNRRAGATLVHELPLLQALPAWLAGVSVAASLEDARLAAAMAHTALLTALHRLLPPEAGGSGGDALAPAPTDLKAAVHALAAAVGQVASEAGARGPAHASAQSAAVDMPGVHLLLAAEAAKTVLLLLQRWADATQWQGSRGDDQAVSSMCASLLELSGDWLAAAPDVQATAAASSPEAAAAAEALTTSVLSAALVALQHVPTAPAGGDGLASPAAAPLLLQSTQQAALQAAGQQLLPLLLAACQPAQPVPEGESGRRQQQQLALAASLTTALIERVAPPGTWLPLLRSHLNIAALLTNVLQRLAAAASSPLQQQQQPQQKQQAQGQPRAPPPPPAAGAAAASAEEAALLLALQVAQARGGPALLEQQGVVPPLLGLVRWLMAPEGGGLMAETPQVRGQGPWPGLALPSSLVTAPLVGQLSVHVAAALAARTLHHGAPSCSSSCSQDRAPSPPIDYSNAYLQDSSPCPAHRLWCSALGLLGLLLAALPGHAGLERGALQLAAEAEPRLLLAVQPPAAGRGQPLTLAMAQEAKYSLFLLCGLARLAGLWRAALPHMVPCFRRAAAGLLAFSASPGSSAAAGGPLHCSPVSANERAAAGAGSEALQISGGAALVPPLGTQRGPWCRRQLYIFATFSRHHRATVPDSPPSPTPPQPAGSRPVRPRALPGLHPAATPGSWRSSCTPASATRWLSSWRWHPRWARGSWPPWDLSGPPPPRWRRCRRMRWGWRSRSAAGGWRGTPRHAACRPAWQPAWACRQRCRTPWARGGERRSRGGCTRGRRPWRRLSTASKHIDAHVNKR